MARAAGVEQRLVVAREHFEIREQVVRPQHRLGAAQLRVAGNDGVRVFARHGQQRAQHAGQASCRIGVDLLAQPQAHIERDLFVAAAAGVDLVGELADALLQFADDQGMDVFVGGAVEESGIAARLSGSPRRLPPAAALLGGEIPTRSSARAKACEPRQSASSRRLSKWSEPEKRSNTSDGPASNRPPQSFMGLWRTHSCVLRSHSCERLSSMEDKRRDESRRGTHECVRHGASS